jgi:hypothetical protein
MIALIHKPHGDLKGGLSPLLGQKVINNNNNFLTKKLLKGYFSLLRGNNFPLDPYYVRSVT